jgi:hypothetical protein
MNEAWRLPERREPPPQGCYTQRYPLYVKYGIVGYVTLTWQRDAAPATEEGGPG